MCNLNTGAQNIKCKISVRIIFYNFLSTTMIKLPNLTFHINTSTFSVPTPTISIISYKNFYFLINSYDLRNKYLWQKINKGYRKICNKPHGYNAMIIFNIFYQKHVWNCKYIYIRMHVHIFIYQYWRHIQLSFENSNNC